MRSPFGNKYYVGIANSEKAYKGLEGFRIGVATEDGGIFVTKNMTVPENEHYGTVAELGSFPDDDYYPRIQDGEVWHGSRRIMTKQQLDSAIFMYKLRKK